MNDEQLHAAAVVRELGIAALVLVALLNAGGLAFVVATGGLPSIGWTFLGGLAATMLTILAEYLVAQAIAAGIRPLSRRNVDWLVNAQIALPVCAGLLFFGGAAAALLNLS